MEIRMSKMIEVVIDSVRVSLMSAQRIVVLRQKDSQRYLPIWVGPYEAEAITVALQEVEMSRPLTHDLLKNVIHSFHAKVLRVEIIDLKEDIYFGNIVVDVNGKVMAIDSRPSDAIALAVRTHSTILVNSVVMETAGVIPEADIREQPAGESSTEGSTASASSEDNIDRLSVFEDFLKKLDKDKKDSSEPPVN